MTLNKSTYKGLSTAWTLQELLKFAEISDLVYETDSSKVVEGAANLGMSIEALAVDPSFTCYVLHDELHVVIAIQGTRFTASSYQTRSLPEIWDNLDILPVSPDHSPTVDAKVMAGYYQPMASYRNHICSVLRNKVVMRQDDARRLVITGHSMGGARAHLMRMWFPKASVVSFGAPKCGNEAFWQQGSRDVCRVVNANDFAPAYLLDEAMIFMNENDRYVQPESINMTWLNDGIVQMTNSRGIRDPLKLSISDHDIVNGYIASIKALIEKHGAGIQI